MTTKQYEKYKANKAKEEKMKSLIKAALLRFDADTLLDFLFVSCDENGKDDLKHKMIDLTTENGGVYIKCQNLNQYSELEAFVNTELFPYYNEQQAFLNF